MTYTVPRHVVESVYEALAVSSGDQLAPHLADDVEWTISGPVDVLSFCGRHRGKAAVVELIGQRVPKIFQIDRLVPELILIDGERASLLSRVSGKKTDDGRSISYRIAQFIRFRDDKVVEYRSLIDSFDAVEQMLGCPIEVHEGRPSVGSGGLVAL